MALDAIAVGLIVNPYSGAVGAALAAMVWTRARTWRGVAVGAAVLLGAWILGEALLRVVLASGMLRAGEEGARYSFWIGSAVSLAFGYVLPAVTGAFVGRRVTWGTGWLSAAVVAVSTSAAVVALGRAVAERMAGIG